MAIVKEPPAKSPRPAKLRQKPSYIKDFVEKNPPSPETHCEDPRQADRSLCFPSLIDVAVRECPGRSANIGEQALDLPRGQPSPARFGFVPSNPEGIRRSLPE